MLSMIPYFTNVPKHKLLMADMERRGAELFTERVMILMNGDSNGSQTKENTHEIMELPPSRKTLMGISVPPR